MLYAIYILITMRQVSVATKHAWCNTCHLELKSDSS